MVNGWRPVSTALSINGSIECVENVVNIMNIHVFSYHNFNCAYDISSEALINYCPDIFVYKEMWHQEYTQQDHVNPKQLMCDSGIHAGFMCSWYLPALLAQHSCSWGTCMLHRQVYLLQRLKYRCSIFLSLMRKWLIFWSTVIFNLSKSFCLECYGSVCYCI